MNDRQAKIMWATGIGASAVLVLTMFCIPFFGCTSCSVTQAIYVVGILRIILGLVLPILFVGVCLYLAPNPWKTGVASQRQTRPGDPAVSPDPSVLVQDVPRASRSLRLTVLIMIVWLTALSLVAAFLALLQYASSYPQALRATSVVLVNDAGAQVASLAIDNASASHSPKLLLRDGTGVAKVALSQDGLHFLEGDRLVATYEREAFAVGDPDAKDTAVIYGTVRDRVPSFALATTTQWLRMHVSEERTQKQTGVKPTGLCVVDKKTGANRFLLEVPAARTTLEIGDSAGRSHVVAQAGVVP